MLMLNIGKRCLALVKVVAAMKAQQREAEAPTACCALQGQLKGRARRHHGQSPNVQ